MRLTAGPGPGGGAIALPQPPGRYKGKGREGGERKGLAIWRGGTGGSLPAGRRITGGDRSSPDDKPGRQVASRPVVT